MSESTNRLILQLANELPAVERVEHLRRSVLRVGASALPLTGVWLVVTHLLGIRRPLPSVAHLFEMPPVYFVVALALAFFALSGLVAALAAGIPGRETPAHVGRGLVMATGLFGMMALAATLAHGTTSASASQTAQFSWLHCASTAAFLGLIPLWVCIRIASKGVPRRPLRAVFFACIGAVGLSALTVHLTCPNLATVHQWVGHGLAPLMAGTLIWLGIRLSLGRDPIDARLQ